MMRIDSGRDSKSRLYFPGLRAMERWMYILPWQSWMAHQACTSTMHPERQSVASTKGSEGDVREPSSASASILRPVGGLRAKMNLKTEKKIQRHPQRNVSSRSFRTAKTLPC